MMHLLLIQSGIAETVFAFGPVSPVAVSGLNPASKTTLPQDIDEIRKRGFTFLRNSDWIAAKLVFENVLKIEPKDTLSLYGIALALFNLGSLSESETYLVKSIEIQSSSSDSKQNLADCFVLSALISAVRNDTNTAIATLEKAVTLVPKHFDAQFSLGRAYFGVGNIGKAALAFKRAAEILPNDVRARYFLASALERLGDLAEALSEYKQITVLRPESAEGHLGVGALLVKSEGDTSQEGLAALEKAVRLNGDLYEARVMLGKTLIRRNRASEAIVHLIKATELGPANPEPHFQLAIAYRKLGRKGEADAESEKVRKIHESRRGNSKSKP